MNNKSGQATVFIIIAIALVVVIGGYFIIQNIKVTGGGIPENLQEVYTYYDECIRQDLSDAVYLVETQGGRVDPGVYIPGSEYAPFSSQLNFLGFPVPYWFYMSGNGIIKENVPTKAEMQIEIEKYLEKTVSECDFSAFTERDYDVSLGKPSVKLTVREDKVVARVDAILDVSKGEESAKVNSREIEFSSKLGKLFDEALRVYDKQKKEAIIENYTVDIMRLYAPVDGVLIQCNPQIWKTQEVVQDLQNGLEANLGSLKFGNKKEGDYFTIEHESSNIRVMYSKNWPHKIEIHGDGVKESAMIADAVGNQQGMGIMGFCYVPYHFVYDISFPVMFQVFEGEEVFQFPSAIIIDKNLPRQGAFTETEFSNVDDFDFCAEKTNEINVKTYDAKLNKIDADISYTCFNQRCDLGKTVNGELATMAPACINGQLLAEAENYSEQEKEFSSNSETEAELILDKIYEGKAEVRVNGQPLKGTAMVVFEGKTTATAALPQSSDIKLSEGSYVVRVYVYGNSSITIPASKSTQCVQVSKSGLSGLFGATQEKCFDVNLPETKIEYALIGGGASSTYIFPEDLEKGKIRLDVSSLPTPSSLEQLQTNYELFESKTVDVTYG